MEKNLVIVESPAKAKTIEKFLGKDFKVVSCYGHIADLPSNELGVNVEGDFKPKYIVSSEKKKVVTELKKMAKQTDVVWLASDEDREGEAIAWHLANNLDLKNKITKRIVFNEITQNAILTAIENPREINENLVNAQQARRVLDRLVGYELSPVLWRKIKGGLSAGRVQSVSVRLIVEKEREINLFIPEESYKTTALFKTDKDQKIDTQGVSVFSSKLDASSFLEKNVSSKYYVESIEKKPLLRKPPAPFTTSTMQQEASSKLSFSVGKTMNVAQKLYEAGLITYMRTDSVRLSDDFKKDLKIEIENRYGASYHLSRNYKNKNSSAQQAHEAIRPTNPANDKIQLDYDQLRLYQLIWKRTIASQMSDAKIEKTQIKIKLNKSDEFFIAIGEILQFEGFLKVYIDDSDSSKFEGILPDLKKGDELFLKEMIVNQKFSNPPYRYSEASLVRKLEELGIGRPSTYAPTISTIQNRGYVKKGISEGKTREYIQIRLEDNEIKEQTLTEKTGSEKGKLIPTDIGIIVNDFLVANFKNILDYGFTAGLEQSFDQISEGNQDWTKIIKDFYEHFHKNVDDVKENAERESGERILGKDPKSGRDVKVRLARFGPVAQIGNVEDDDKPIFAGFTPDLQLEKISLDQALELFKLPKNLGNYNGDEVVINNGKFGPYVKNNGMFVSIQKTDDPMEINLERAIELIEEKKKADEPITTYKDFPVTKGSGRFGPFIKWNGKFINVNRKYDFDNLTEENIVELIEEKIQKEKEKLITEWSNEGIRVEKGRWGRTLIIKGSKKIQLGKDVDPKKITLEKAIKYLDSKKK